MQLTHEFRSNFVINKWNVNNNATGNERQCGKVFRGWFCKNRCHGKEYGDSKAQNWNDGRHAVWTGQIGLGSSQHQQANKRRPVEEPNEKRCKLNKCTDISDDREQKANYELQWENP